MLLSSKTRVNRPNAVYLDLLKTGLIGPTSVKSIVFGYYDDRLNAWLTIDNA